MGENEQGGMLRTVVVVGLVAMVALIITLGVVGLKNNMTKNTDNAVSAIAKENGQQVSGRNYVKNSSGLNGSPTDRPTLVGYASWVNVKFPITYQSDGILMTNTATNTNEEWFYEVASAWTKPSDTPLKPGKPITFSVDVKGTVPQAVLRYGFNGETWQEGYKSFDINNTSWTRISLTATPAPNNALHYFRIQGGNNNQFIKGWSGGETLKFRHVKVEDGNTPTPWTPAPED